MAVVRRRGDQPAVGAASVGGENWYVPKLLEAGGVGKWNVVTGYLPAAARNMGQTDQPAHDARYDHADEYLEVPAVGAAF